MSNMESEQNMRGQAEIWRYMFSFVDSMALRCAVELRIPDIINSHGAPITLSQIASSIPEDSAASSIPFLARIMRFLVRSNIFTAHHPSNSSAEDQYSSSTLYGLTPSSRWLLSSPSDQLTLAPMLIWLTDPTHITAIPHLSQCIKEGGAAAFEKVHGSHLFTYMSENPEFRKIFHDGMECTSRIILKAVLEEHGDHGFGSLGSLVDVGGGTGGAISEIVKSYPHIKGINFDMPYMVATAPVYPGVSHVGGDMFESIPNADAVFMKWILHDWEDEDCVKILKNCRKAIPEKSGKVIIVDAVVDLKGKGIFDGMGLVFDIAMAALYSGGKERNEKEWNKLLKEGGFPRYKIIKIPAILSIIEAYTE